MTQTSSSDRAMTWLMRNLQWVLPVTFVIWNVLSLSILAVGGDHFSAMTTNWLSLAYVVYLPALPLLRPLGLVVDAYWSAPKMGGIILAGIFYSAILFVIGKLIQRLRRLFE